MLTKTFDIFQKLLWNITSTLPHFECLGLYLVMFDKIEALCTKNEDFDQKYLNTGSKTQNVEVLVTEL